MAGKACHVFRSTARLGLTLALGLMSRFSQTETNLRRAGYVLLAEVLGGVALGMLLSHLGYGIEAAILLVWVANLPAAWFLARAARLQGRNAWLTGFTSLPPLLAVVNFWLLWATAGSHRSPQAS